MNVMKLSHNDCGQRTRTNFELSESGENQQILDEIQYQIDCLKSANANSQSKRKALAALTKIFSVSINASMRRRFIGKVQDIFAVLSGLFAKTSSWTTEFFLSGMQLVIVLNADGDGSFDPTLVLPKRLLSAILRDHNPQCGNALCSCLSSAHGTAQETTGLFGETRSESIEVGHHRKRKFTKNSTRNDEDSKAKAPENSARLDMKKGGSTDDLLSTLAETFWCPTCAQKCATIAGGGSSGGGIVHHSSILQLVILNRTLTAKVATLASVHTEFFQTATNAINSEPSNDDGEVMHSPKKASLSDLALRSPDDPSSRSSKAFFQRQADALVQLQALMQDHAEDCGGDRQFSCYLDHLCKRLREDARSAMGMLAEQRQQQQQQQLAGGGAAQASKSSLSRQGTLFGRMWLMLGILDSACFRSPQIQV